MYKYCILLLLTVFSVSFSKAGTAVSKTGYAIDSIGVENSNGKKVIVHQVVSKDTYYSIGRKYQVKPNDILTYNNNKYLQVGVIVKVPTDRPFSDKSTSAASENSTAGNSNIEQAPLKEHIVQKRENLNLLARKYGTTVNEIKRVNNLNTINLSIGQVLMIPSTHPDQESEQTTTAGSDDKATTQPVSGNNTATRNNANVSTGKMDIAVGEGFKKPAPTLKVTKDEPVKEEFIQHVVSSNETMYSIASKYKLTVDQLKAKNKMTASSLYVGQKLLIKGEWPVEETFEQGQENDDSDTINSLKNPSLRYPASRYGLNEMDEKGTGVWIADQDLDPSKMYVLHRSAPIGTVMKITNPMSNRTALAKVVGKFTENESTKDVIIVMTKAVADALGALDKRFFCNLSYGAQQQNEQ